MLWLAYPAGYLALALLVLSAEADVRTFDTAGNPTNLPLPAGSYIVLPTPVALESPPMDVA